MALPRMLKIRQTFPRPRVADIPRAVAAALAGAALTLKRGDTVAVGAGSRGIANLATSLASLWHLPHVSGILVRSTLERGSFSPHRLSLSWLPTPC